MSPSTKSPVTLPATSKLSPAVKSFLNTTFRPKHDFKLTESTHLVTELDTECSRLTRQLADLTRQLEALLLSYASSSRQIGAAFDGVRHRVEDLKSISSSFAASSDGGGEQEKQMVVEELPALAKEVKMVEIVRNYAETTLKLNQLVGEIEDEVSSVMNRTLKKHPITQSLKESHTNAITTLNIVEDVLVSVMKDHPQWARLVSATDERVNRALASLRPQSIADHRTLLSSLGWPPPLSTLSSSISDSGRTSEVMNPISGMHGDLKKNYCESFLALCSLQQLQRRRKLRQLEGHRVHVAQYQPLWGIEELVDPLARASYTHFQRWIEKPEFIFALVYKITRDYIDSIDELLQPLVDKAMLTGYNCREEWISAMVTSLSTYLAKEIFSAHCSHLSEESTTDVRLHTRMSWLHLVDLMISFDKRIRALASHSGIIDSADYSLLQRMSSLSVFCDRPDWLDIWAEIEFATLLEKLKPEMEDDRNWIIKTQGMVIPGSDDYKSPTISFILLEQVEWVIERCKSLPTVVLRSQFVRLVGVPIIQEYLKCLLNKCLEAEGLTALADDDALGRVSTSINSARHIGSVLRVRSDDDFFLEMALENEDHSFDSSVFDGIKEEIESGVFKEEIRGFEEFRKEWVGKITNVVLRGFEAQIRDYVRNKKQWQENVEEGWTVSQPFLAALDYLQGKLSTLQEGLNNEDFITVWKNVAKGVDRMIFNNILTSYAKFHDGGVVRLGGDMDVLFGVFKSWCLRPEGFFPRMSEGLRLLKMGEDDFHDLFAQGETWMKNNKFRHFSKTEAEKIAKCRVFKH